MDYLIDKYLKEPEYVKELLNKSVQISLKIDGEAFQIGYDKEKDEVTYHKRGGSSKKLGPIIDEYTQLFRKKINDAIDTFNNKKDVIKQNKFYAIEMFNGNYILLTVIDHNDNVIEDVKTINKIANQLGIDPVPIMFNGVLNKEQQENIINLMTLDENTSNDVFKEYLNNTFGKGDYNKFLKGPEVEGIVLTWNNSGNIEQMKIINPAFKSRHGKEIENSKKQAEAERDSINALTERLYEILNEVGQNLNKNWFANLDANLVNIFNNEQYAKELKDLANKIPYVKKDFWELQMNKTTKDIKSLIKKHGDIIKVIYESYMKTFYKIRKRNYIISKDFNLKVNALIERLQKTTNESYKSLKEYVLEKLNK